LFNGNGVVPRGRKKRKRKKRKKEEKESGERRRERKKVRAPCKLNFSWTNSLAPDHGIVKQAAPSRDRACTKDLIG